MKHIVLMACLAVAFPASLLGAQDRPGPPDSARRAALRAQIERRFAEHVRRELGLTDDQAAKLRATQERYGERRRALLERQRELRQALGAQMRPGQAANPDSVRQLMDALQAGRAELFKLEQEEDREMATYLSPVQRARFQMMRERFLQRVQELRRGREWGGRGRGWGRDPMDRPRRPPAS
ncbi:MAG TPA: hypothetical protein VNI61_05420 [Gemmatimonadales bacterium]|nr:hypothetical protein [Gemmatimonadales bacterium]